MDFVTTNKDAGFVITDLHLFHSLANRYDYYSENVTIVERIERMVSRYRNMGYSPYAIFDGDVAHRGTANDFLNDRSSQLIKYLISLFDKSFLNIGNHEISYFKNNPIFKYIKSIEDERIRERYPHIKGTSFIEEIRVVSELNFEDFEIIFCPYGCIPIRGEKKTSLLIMHDKLLSDAAHTRMSSTTKGYKIMRTVVQEDVFTYIFCGDQHMAYEKWMLGTTKVYNLSTLGRTNVLEIDDSFRERVIPVILSEGGKFDKVVDELILLHKRSDIVDEDRVIISKGKYLETKERKELRESLSVYSRIDPVTSLMDDIELSGNQSLKTMMDSILAGRLVEFIRTGG